MAKSKILHYASYEAPHEGDNCGYYSDPLCGYLSENLTPRESEVTCKKCLKKLKGVSLQPKLIENK